MDFANRTDSQQSVSAYLVWDHDQIDGILAGVLEMIEDEEWERAEHHFREFSERLRRHIRFEEEELFPIFTERLGPGDPVTVMRAEHRAIESAVSTMESAIAEESATAFHVGFDGIMSVLPEHNAKEEHILYPAIERLLSDGDRRALLDKLG